MTSQAQTSARTRAAALRFIVCLGIVSLFADMTYEGAHSIIGPYLKDLGATAFQVALIAGIGEMLGASLRFFSGRFADRTRSYWAITFAGYSMNEIAVPALAYAMALGRSQWIDWAYRIEWLLAVAAGVWWMSGFCERAG